MRIRVAVPVLAACLAVATTACGGSSTGSPAAASSSSASSSASLTVAKARQLAAAGVLTDADLPGFASKPQTHDANDVANENKAQQCLGRPTATFLTRNYGTSFSKGTVEVDSSADVATSAADAKAQLAALQGSKAPGCFVQVFKQAMASSGITVKSVSVKPISATVPGSDGSFAYQLTIDATAQGQTVHLTGFELGALVGQVEIELSSIAFGGATVTLDDATALVGKAVKRVRAAA